MTTRTELAKIWRELARDTGGHGSVRRRVLPGLAHDVFIGENRPDRQRVLMLQIHERHDVSQRRRPSSRGVVIDVDASRPDGVDIRLASTTYDNDSLFMELTADVIGVIASNPTAGLAARVLNRIAAWQRFFATRPHEFSAEQAAGLFTELHVLESLLIPAIGPSRAIAAWTGADPAIQDFQTERATIEVKSFRGTGSGRLTISSEQQLDTAGSADLYVAYIRIDQRSDGPGASIPDAINRIRTTIMKDQAAVYAFGDRIVAYGWTDAIAEYRTERFEVRSSEYFHVADGFPRIIVDMLPLGVGAVSYSIDRAAIERFLASPQDLTRALRN